VQALLQQLLDFFIGIFKQLFAPLIGPFTRAVSLRRQDDGSPR
jgi:hypothetical protein